MEIYCTKKDNPNGTMELFNLFIIIISESIKKIRVAKLYSCDISSGSGSIYIHTTGSGSMVQINYRLVSDCYWVKTVIVIYYCLIKTVIGRHKSRDLFYPITIAVRKNKRRSTCIMSKESIALKNIFFLLRSLAIKAELYWGSEARALKSVNYRALLSPNSWILQCVL